MKEITFERGYGRDKETHRIVYILYHGRTVFEVTTDELNEKGEWDGFQNHFDIELDCKEIEKYMYHHSGSGGNIKELQAPHLVKGTDSTYWIHPDAAFKGKPKNI